MAPVLKLSLRQLAGRWRLLLIVCVAGLPVILVGLLLYFTGERPDGALDEGFGDVIFDGLFIGAIVPVVAMALATAAFGNEVEDRTLSYLMLKPVSKIAIALPKLLASISIGGPLLVISGGVTAALATGEIRAAAAVAGALLIGLVCYTSIFTWAGLMTRSALGFALLYVFIWEGLISTFLGGVSYFSVRAYSLAIMHELDDKTFSFLDERVIQLPAATGGVIFATAAFFALTVYRLRQMDVP